MLGNTQHVPLSPARPAHSPPFLPQLGTVGPVSMATELSHRDQSWRWVSSKPAKPALSEGGFFGKSLEKRGGPQLSSPPLPGPPAWGKAEPVWWEKPPCAGIGLCPAPGLGLFSPVMCMEQSSILVRGTDSGIIVLGMQILFCCAIDV